MLTKVASVLNGIYLTSYNFMAEKPFIHKTAQGEGTSGHYRELSSKIFSGGTDVLWLIFKSGVYAAVCCLFYAAFMFMKSRNAQERDESKKNVVSKGTIIFIFFSMGFIFSAVQSMGFD